jgi:flagellar hook-length control protein FliK
VAVDTLPGTTPATAAATTGTPAAPTPAVTTAHAAAPASVDTTSRPAQPAPVPPFTHDRARFEHLVEGLSARLHVSRSEGGSSLRMTLRPEELGAVTVRLHVAADGTAVASVVADTQQAAGLLAQAADDLRKALADRGLQLDRLDVQSGGGSTLADARSGGAGSEAGQTGRDGAAPRTFYSFRAETAATPVAATVEARDGDVGHSYLA